MPPVFGPRSPSSRALVILRARERQRRLPSVMRDEAGFLALEELFDHDRAPASPNARCRACRASARSALGDRRRDDDALAGREPVGLDHDGAPRVRDVGVARSRGP